MSKENKTITINCSAIETIFTAMGDKKAAEFIGSSIRGLAGKNNPYVEGSLENAMWRILKQNTSVQTLDGKVYSAPRGIDEVDEDGNVIKHYPTTAECLKALGLTYGNESKDIWRCCQGYIETALGRRWKWSS